MSGPFASTGRSLAGAVRTVLHADTPAIDDGCETEAAAAAARTAIEAGSRLVIGLPCIDAFDGAAPALAQADIAMLAVGLQAKDITQPPRGITQWPVFRVGAPAHQEHEALAEHIATHWRNFNFAIIDDGTLYGRRLSETVRLLLGDAAIEPVFVDTYRPLLENQVALVRRLQRAGATHVLIGGDARDAAVIAKAAILIGYRLELAGGSALVASPEDGRLPDGTLVATIPASIALGRMAAQIAQTALNDPAVAPSVALRSTRFETDWGPISFANDGEPDFSFFRMHTIRNGRPEPLAQDMDG